MEQVKKINLNIVSCFVVGVITGVLVGISVFSIIISYRMDMFYEKIAYLENTIENKNVQLEKLEKSINNRNFILKDIEVVLIFDGDDIDKIEIEKSIKEKYRGLLGKEVKQIDADIITKVVDSRILKIEDREYKLHVNKLILSDTLKLLIKVESKDKYKSE